MAGSERSLINAGVSSLDEAIASLGLSSGASPPPASLVFHGNRIASLSVSSQLKLPSLRSLNVSSNEVAYADVGDLSSLCPALEGLDLAANRVVSVRGLSTLRALSSLNLAFNALTDLRWLAELGGGGGPHPLTRLDLRDNAIEDPSELFNLRHAPLLRELRLRSAELQRDRDGGGARVTATCANPVCGRSTYLPIVLAACPALLTLDGVPVAAWRDSLAAVQAQSALLSAAASPPPLPPPAGRRLR